MPRLKDEFPDFTRLADREVARQLQLVWERIGDLQRSVAEASAAASAAVQPTRRIVTVPPLFGGGDLAGDLRFALPTPQLCEASPFVVVSKSATLTLTDNVAANVSFNVTIDDRYDMRHPTDQTALLVGLPGWYYVFATATFAVSATGAGALRLPVRAADTTAAVIRATVTGVFNNTVGNAFQLHRLVPLRRGDVVRLQLLQNTGGPLDVSADSSTTPLLVLWWVRPL